MSRGSFGLLQLSFLNSSLNCIPGKGIKACRIDSYSSNDGFDSGTRIFFPTLNKKQYNSKKNSTQQYEFFNKKNGKFFVIEEEEFPFVITTLKFKNKALYNEKINIVPINDEYYQISFDTSTLMSKLKGSNNILELEEKYKYNTLIENDLFTIEVTKKERI